MFFPEYTGSYNLHFNYVTDFHVFGSTFFVLLVLQTSGHFTLMLPDLQESKMCDEEFL